MCRWLRRRRQAGARPQFLGTGLGSEGLLHDALRLRRRSQPLRRLLDRSFVGDCASPAPLFAFRRPHSSPGVLLCNGGHSCRLAEEVSRNRSERGEEEGETALAEASCSNFARRLVRRTTTSGSLTMKAIPSRSTRAWKDEGSSLNVSRSTSA